MDDQRKKDADTVAYYSLKGIEALTRSMQVPLVDALLRTSGHLMIRRLMEFADQNTVIVPEIVIQNALRQLEGHVREGLTDIAKKAEGAQSRRNS